LSLESLVALRRSGHAPLYVHVVIGEPPHWFDPSHPDRVVIRHGTDAHRIDWRAVTGLHVEFFEVGDHAALMHDAIDAAEAADCKFGGLASHAAVMGLDERHESLLWKTWRHLNGILA
jgi:hypothetical protein